MTFPDRMLMLWVSASIASIIFIIFLLAFFAFNYHPPTIVKVICEVTQTNTQIYIHNSTTETLTQLVTKNSTQFENISSMSC